MNDLGWRIFIGVVCFLAGALVYILNDEIRSWDSVKKARTAEQEAYIAKVNMLEDRVQTLSNRIDGLESGKTRLYSDYKFNYKKPEEYEWKSVRPASVIEKGFYKAIHGKTD